MAGVITLGVVCVYLLLVLFVVALGRAARLGDSIARVADLALGEPRLHDLDDEQIRHTRARGECQVYRFPRDRGAAQ